VNLEEDELYQCENAMPLGRGIAPTPLYAGDRGASIHPGSVIKESAGFSLTYGTNAAPHPVTIAVFEDGSAWMRDHYLDGALDSMVAPVGTFSPSPNVTHITIWQDGPILFIDQLAGYSKWTGTAYTVIDASKKGTALAVFSGYTFLLVAPRTITVTAPNTFDDFSVGDGATTFKITDEAFQGAVQALLSTVSQLWIVGVSAIDALGNITTQSAVTTFSVTNAVNTVGSAFSDSVIGYYRSLVFATGYSIHSLLGVTPQKLSAAIDTLFDVLGPAIQSGPRPGVVELNGVVVLCYLYAFTDPVSGDTSTKLICFDEGKWFTAATPDLGGNRVLDMVTLTIRQVPEIYGIDQGGYIYRIFARASDAKGGTVVLGGPLSDGGNPVMGQQAFYVGFDFSAPENQGLTTLDMTLTTESLSVERPGILQKFSPVADAWLGRRYSFFRTDAPISGARIGWTLSYPAADLVMLEAHHLHVQPTQEWEPIIGQPGAFVWLDGAAVFEWADGATEFDWVDV
jgi:hypothetical protein